MLIALICPMPGWVLIEPVLPAWRQARSDAGLGLSGPVRDLREIVNAILYLNRSGIAWEYLPHDFPPCKDCAQRAPWRVPQAPVTGHLTASPPRTAPRSRIRPGQHGDHAAIIAALCTGHPPGQHAGRPLPEDTPPRRVLSREFCAPPVLMSSFRLSMRQQWFTHVRLLVAHLTR